MCSRFTFDKEERELRSVVDATDHLVRLVFRSSSLQLITFASFTTRGNVRDRSAGFTCKLYLECLLLRLMIKKKEKKKISIKHFVQILYINVCVYACVDACVRVRVYYMCVCTARAELEKKSQWKECGPGRFISDYFG